MPANPQLLLMLGKIETRLTVIEVATTKLDKAINGNGRPGIVEDHRVLLELFRKHCERDEQDRQAQELLAQQAEKARQLLATETKDAKDKLAFEVKEKRDKVSVRTWAVIMVFITQAVGLLLLFIRTGGLR
jgi:hypothetical protein